MHILLIEPDAVAAPLYAAGLRAADHTVATAASAQAAIGAADRKQPDVVIMEMQLGTHNGIAFLQEFRSYAEWQSVPVIVHSFQKPPTDTAVLDVLQREYGMRSWLYKPQTSIAALASAVHRLGIPA
ncbi:MAG TPA: response regulator [Candidatus Saccharimonadales bacterium]|nr:response regulator [Candidatus Saccharimonadales bacterium]